MSRVHSAHRYRLDVADFQSEDLSTVQGNDAGEVQLHDGPGLLPRALCRWDGSNWHLGEMVDFTYTGDGTEDRTLLAWLQFEMVLVESPGGTSVDAWKQIGSGALGGNSFPGELTVETTGGFTVGDNGNDAEPNADGSTYQVVAA